MRELTSDVVGVIGAGGMGSQIGVEYALGGYRVCWIVRDRERAQAQVSAAIELARDAGLVDARGAGTVCARMSFVGKPEEIGEPVKLVVESVAEDLQLKIELIGQAAACQADAAIASNTSSLSVTQLGRASGAGPRLVGTHYWNPPLLMPLVELVAGEDTSANVVKVIKTMLCELGKRPIEIRRDVPGFAWNRLQLALLREALWLVEQGVLTPADVDEVVSDGLARRWRLAGPFQSVSLGGAATFDAIAANLFPELSDAQTCRGFARHVPSDLAVIDRLRRRRDEGLIRDLHETASTQRGGN